jgi:hypothetical protein
MNQKLNLTLTVAALAGAFLPGLCADDLTLTRLGTYATGVYNKGAAEIVAHDPATQRLFVVNGDRQRIDVLDIRNPASPTLAFFIDVTPYGKAANSVAVNQGIVAAAVEANVKTDPGQAVFFDAHGRFLKAVTVGALPDMITFTPNGRKVLVANEGEPNDAYTIDPVGSVSIIPVSPGMRRLTQANVVTLDFSAFNSGPLPAGLRVFGPNATVAQDLEPEYIAVAKNSRTAWVTLQENNGLAEIDLDRPAVTRLISLGAIDHNLPGFGIDASDKDGPAGVAAINIANWPVFGMFQPDGIAAFSRGGDDEDEDDDEGEDGDDDGGHPTYLITANEGDARDYAGFKEEARVKDLALDATLDPYKTDAQLGRLNVSKVEGNLDNDAAYEALYAFGTRSFSIWTTDGDLVFDSGDELERLTAALYPANFNASNSSNALDDRSDNKGPEPEGVVLGKAWGTTYAFIGLERIGGVAVYDLTDPAQPRFVDYVNNRDFSKAPNTAAAGDLGPEGLHFIPASRSPVRQPLLVVANEVSGTTTIFRVDRAP